MGIGGGGGGGQIGNLVGSVSDIIHPFAPFVSESIGIPTPRELGERGIGFAADVSDFIHPVGNAILRGIGEPSIGESTEAEFSGLVPDEGGGGGPAGPQPPQDKATLPDQTTFTRPGVGEVGDPPGFVGPGLAGLTPLQQRSKIATFGVSGEDPRFREQAVRDYYTSLLFRELVEDSGSVAPGAQVLPIERQYLTEVLGQTPRADSTESFLSAFLRI